MKIKVRIQFRLPIISIIFMLLSTIVNAQTPPTVYVAGDGSGDYNCDGTSDQIEINQALNFVANNSNFTSVYLKGPNLFIIDEPVYISSNTILTGDSTATIKLKDNVGWNTENKPMLAQTGRVGWDSYGDPSESISNVEIFGFTMDAGLFQLEVSGARYNTIIHFTFPNNILIHDMHFKNGQWDAIRLSASEITAANSKAYNNLIYACGHDAISFVGVKHCEVFNNEIYKTRTNAGIRVTECDSVSIHNNIIGNSISMPSSGYAGIIIQNDITPFSFGEVYENVIYGKNGGIHVGSVGTSSYTYPTETRSNVHVHHNKIYKSHESDAGGGVILDGGIVINGFQNTLIEHNIIDGGDTDGIIYKGTAGGETGYQTIVRNNIIINNVGYGISNELPAVNTFISNNNLVYNNGAGNYNNVTSTDDINSDPLFGVSNSALNQWHHIVASYDNTTESMKIYIDGVEKSSVSYPGLFGTIGSNTYNLYLGTSYGNYWYEGRQDELAIWNRALTTSEVNTLYNNGSPINITGSITSDMQAYFQMENNWNDASGNAFQAEDSTASFTNNAIIGSYAGLFDGIDDAVQYPNSISTTNGLSISVWVYRTGLNNEIQTIVNKGNPSDFNNIWLYFKGESVIFELGNGSDRTSIEAYITNPEDIDYHIKSEYGRWDGSSWIIDGVSSPCIDSGFLTSDYLNEQTPNGSRVNIGVYGNTSEASKSSSTTSISEYDTNNLVVFPNPTSGQLYFQNQLISSSFEIYAITGAIVKSGEIKTNEIDLSELTKGIYLLKINDNNLNKTKYVKIIKE